MGSVVEPSFYAKVARFLIDGGDEEAAGLLLTCRLDVRWKRVTSQDVYTVEIGAPRSAYDILRQSDHPVAMAVQRAFTAFLLPGRVGFNIYPQVEIENHPDGGDWRADVLRALTREPNEFAADVHRGMSLLGGLVVGNLERVLQPFVSEHRLGYVVTGMLCRLGESDDEMYTADLCFVRQERFPADFDPAEPFPAAPDLVVLVTSPLTREESGVDDTRRFLSAGSEQVWVLYPSARELHQYRSDEPNLIRAFSDDDRIDADALFPSLTLSAADVFALPEL
ncbi:MAG: Uma2 family endonuclease [Burkholderiales bacterium]|nr:Uma2 family endonuclease [Anaerolineae bacterium]